MEIMSGEEDIELRDLVAQTLESNGSLAKIRAQLRASIFLALEEDTKLSKKQPLLNNKVKSYQKSAQGKAAFCIVREFLDFFNLDFTISVYEPESYSGTGYKYEGQQKLITDLGIDGLEHNSSGPVLLQLLSIAQKFQQVTSEEDLQESKNNIDVAISSCSAKIIDDEIQKEEDESNSKTELDLSSIVNSRNDINNLKSKSNMEIQQSDDLKQDKFDLEIDIPRVHLNHTYNLSSSSTETSEESESENIVVGNDNCNPLETIISPQSVKSFTMKEDSEKGEYEKEDTYEGNSLNSDYILTPNGEQSPQESLTRKSSTNEQYTEEHCTSGIKENKSKYNIDKPKLSPQKAEKLKSKSNLSSLTDLPPLPVGKSRMSDILPSLYNKEFKDKANLKDLDEMFDMQVDYEEDFMSGSELDLSLNKSQVKLTVDLPSRSSDYEKSEQTEIVNGEHARLGLKNEMEHANKHRKGSSSGGNSTSISEHITVNTESSNAPN